MGHRLKESTDGAFRINGRIISFFPAVNCIEYNILYKLIVAYTCNVHDICVLDKPVVFNRPGHGSRNTLTAQKVIRAILEKLFLTTMRNIVIYDKC